MRIDRQAAETARDDLIAFARRLVQTPSLPGHEGDVAGLLRQEMEELGYDRVWTDEVGNVIGLLAGKGGPSLMLNGHMDHVDAGDPGHWLHPPFSGEIHTGELWGRGAVDMKGALAAMVYAGGLLKRLGVCPPGDLLVAGVVQEEVGGLGTRHLARTLSVGRAVIGEASDNELRRGHRGRVELTAHFEGRSVHASMPGLGINPNYSLARFLTGLRELPMASDATFGASSVAPTRLGSEPASANVTPAAVHLVLDWRNIPGESTFGIVAQLEDLQRQSLEPGCRGWIEVGTKVLVSYTGATLRYPDEFPSFTTELNDTFLVQAQMRLSEVLGRQVKAGIWQFATDGGHLAAAGTTVFGFGPGDDTLAHTVRERVPVEQLVESTAGYMALALID